MVPNEDSAYVGLVSAEGSFELHGIPTSTLELELSVDLSIGGRMMSSWTVARQRILAGEEDVDIGTWCVPGDR
jgi:hypothetical protein